MSICYELAPSLSQRRKGSAPGSGRESCPAGEDQRQGPDRGSCQLGGPGPAGGGEGCRQEGELDVRMCKIMLIITPLTEHFLCGRQRATWPGTQLISSSSSTFDR